MEIKITHYFQEDKTVYYAFLATYKDLYYIKYARFHQLNTLHSNLKNIYNKHKKKCSINGKCTDHQQDSCNVLPEFPKKKWFGNTKQEFLKQRVYQLQQYWREMQTLLNSNSELYQFFFSELQLFFLKEGKQIENMREFNQNQQKNFVRVAGKSLENQFKEDWTEFLKSLQNSSKDEESRISEMPPSNRHITTQSQKTPIINFSLKVDNTLAFQLSEKFSSGEIEDIEENLPFQPVGAPEDFQSISMENCMEKFYKKQKKKQGVYSSFSSTESDSEEEDGQVDKETKLKKQQERIIKQNKRLEKLDYIQEEEEEKEEIEHDCVQLNSNLRNNQGQAADNDDQDQKNKIKQNEKINQQLLQQQQYQNNQQQKLAQKNVTLCLQQQQQNQNVSPTHDNKKQQIKNARKKKYSKSNEQDIYTQQDNGENQLKNQQQQQNLSSDFPSKIKSLDLSDSDNDICDYEDFSPLKDDFYKKYNVDCRLSNLNDRFSILLMQDNTGVTNQEDNETTEGGQLSQSRLSPPQSQNITNNNSQLKNSNQEQSQSSQNQQNYPSSQQQSLLSLQQDQSNRKSINNSNFNVQEVMSNSNTTVINESSFSLLTSPTSNSSIKTKKIIPSFQQLHQDLQQQQKHHQSQQSQQNCSNITLPQNQHQQRQQGEVGIQNQQNYQQTKIQQNRGINLTKLETPATIKQQRKINITIKKSGGSSNHHQQTFKKKDKKFLNDFLYPFPSIIKYEEERLRREADQQENQEKISDDIQKCENQE